jgi:hypothetical protein
LLLGDDRSLHVSPLFEAVLLHTSGTLNDFELRADRYRKMAETKGNLEWGLEKLAAERNRRSKPHKKDHWSAE